MHGHACIMSVHVITAFPQAEAHMGAFPSLGDELVRVAACVIAAGRLYTTESASAETRYSAAGLGWSMHLHAHITSARATTAYP